MSEQQGPPPEWSIASPGQAGEGPPVSPVDWGNLEREVLGELLEPSARETPPEFSPPPWPLSPEPAPDISSILIEDYRQRMGRRAPAADSCGESTSVAGRDSLRSIIRGSGFLRSGADDPSQAERARLPDLGDCLFGFQLRRELGRGAFARVFEAEQLDLAGRPVVLKVSRIEGSEPQTLAQLQHTHIVPIFSLHEDPAAGLRAVCMPYFGGASLGQVLQAMSAATSRAKRGQDLLNALDGAARPLPLPQTAPANDDQTPRAILGRLSYVEAVVWIGARLAEALHHAHQRGILHRDVKPQNVLLGGDGQPMLLDFNLAHDDRDPQSDTSLGGTVSYMAPEHLRAVANRDPAQARKVDARADVYSLGMVLFEMLAGRRPFACSIGSNPAAFYLESMAIERSRAAPSLRRLRSDIPWGLDSILRRCLAPVPEERYASAEQLAEDLRRFLADDPLRYAPEPSLKERVRKWVRRHPRLAYGGGVALAALLLISLLGLAWLGTRSLLADTQSELEIKQAQQRSRDFREEVTRALFLVNTTSDLADHLGEGIRTCEHALGIYKVLDSSGWREPPDWGKAVAEERPVLAQEARDLLLLLAGARVRREPGKAEVLHGALRLLETAESIPGLDPSRALWEDRAAYREALGDRDGAAQARTRAVEIQPATAQEHYLVAMTYARSRRYDLAVQHLDRAVQLHPRHYWSFAQRGLCHLERGELELAASDLSVCIGLWPDFAWGYLNRAGVLARCGRRSEAIADYDAALRYDRSLTAVFLNRGLLHLELEHYPAALADFQEAAKRGRDDAFLHSGFGVALERLGRPADADAAFRQAAERAAQLPAVARLRLRWVEGFAIARRKAAEARAAFEEVLRDHPDHPQALYGLGMLLEEDGKLVAALPYYHRALEASPGFVAPRRARAVVLARLGERGRATQEINDCLARDPQSGVTIYAAACVAALLARKAAPAEAQRATAEALRLLGEAFRLHYGQDKAAEDQDLESIRQHPRFRELLEKARKEPGAREP
jgi:serine/threonine protein kinase/Flp pilus assembly protein TadD